MRTKNSHLPKNLQCQLELRLKRDIAVRIALKAKISIHQNTQVLQKIYDRIAHERLAIIEELIKLDELNLAEYKLETEAKVSKLAAKLDANMISDDDEKEINRLGKLIEDLKKTANQQSAIAEKHSTEIYNTDVEREATVQTELR